VQPAQLADAAVPGMPAAGQHVAHLRRAGKDDDARTLGHRGVGQVALQAARHAVVLEADAPALGPVLQQPAPRQLGALELLRDLVGGGRARRVRQVGVEDVDMLPDLEAEHRRVAHAVQETVAPGIQLAQRLGPEQVVVTDDQERARQVEELVERRHDHQVQVQEQRGAAQVVQLAAEDRQLAPAQVAMPRGHAQRRQRQRFDARVQATGIVGEADEAVPALQVADPLKKVTVSSLELINFYRWMFTSLVALQPPRLC